MQIMSDKKLKVAIVHYWFVTWRGGEKVIEELLKIFPGADLYTHVISDEIKGTYLKDKVVSTTFINKLPGAKNHYQKYLPLMPLALEQLDLTGYDLIISSESGPSKGVVTSPDSLHVCYCHSPMRYVWDMYHLYKSKAGLFTRLFMPLMVHYLKIVDRLSADRVDYFIANSRYIEKRISKCYRRSSEVIFPPVLVQDFSPAFEKGDFYLMLGQLVPYKKPDLVVDAFIENGKPLVVIGEGEMFDELKSRSPDNITLLGRVDFEELKGYLGRAKALVFPGIEDFGMVPVEAMASGTPVIAFAKGGALDTVVDNVTGVLFSEQSCESLNDAIIRFESDEKRFSTDTLVKHAQKFSEKSFLENFRGFIGERLQKDLL